MRQVREYLTADGQRRYRVRYRLGKTQTSTTFLKRADAQTFATILDAGGVADALAWIDARDNRMSAITFADWFDAYVRQLTGVTDRTRGDYHSLRRRYLAELDTLPLGLISRGHVTGIVNRLDREGRSAKTIAQTVHLLSTCLGRAVKDGHITANPCEDVRLPTKSSSTQPRFLTHEEAGLLLSHTPEHYRPLVTFLFGTGMRWSEVTALEARHVDLAAGTVRVEQAWKRLPGKGFVIGDPKTQRSKRTVNAAVPALVAVEPLLRRPRDQVFLTHSGGPVRHANFFNNVWRPTCERAGFDPHPRIHDARHSHASWLISDGKSLEQVQDQLGHESILTTRKVYGHLLPALGVEVGRSASAAMERVLAHQVEIGAGLGGLLAIEAGGHPDQ